MVHECALVAHTITMYVQIDLHTLLKDLIVHSICGHQSAKFSQLCIISSAAFVKDVKASMVIVIRIASIINKLLLICFDSFRRMDAPSPAEASSGDVESSSRPSSSGPSGNQPPHFRAVKIGFFIGNIGFMIFLAAVGALGMGSAKTIDDTGLIFVGLYLIVFAGLVFFYELAQVLNWERLDLFMKMNFGFLYGVNGKGVFILL